METVNLSGYEEVLHSLKTNSEVRTENGTTVIFKSSRDLQKGQFDSLLVEDMKHHSQGTADVVSESRQLPDLTDFAVASVMALEMRASMGSENIDLSKDVVTETVVIPGPYGKIHLNVYKRSDQAENVPALVFVHGGGFMGGTPKVVENACKGIAEKAPAVVFNVDYRLAPEFPAPVAQEEVYAAVQWVHDHADTFQVDKDQIAIAGDSAGGNLSAVASYLDRQRGTNYIGFQALMYPVLCLDQENQNRYQWPIEKFEAEPELAKELEIGFDMMAKSSVLIETVYARGMNSAGPLFAPLLVENKAGMPPTFIAVAQFDYLRPFAETYAGQLNEAGVETKTICYQGMQHAFIDKYGILPQAEDCVDELVKMMNGVFNR